MTAGIAQDRAHTGHLQQATVGDVLGQLLQLGLVELRAIVQAGVHGGDRNVNDLFLGLPRPTWGRGGHAASAWASAIAAAFSCRQSRLAGSTCLTSPATATP
jgi:hypothetical protein